MDDAQPRIRLRLLIPSCRILHRVGVSGGVCAPVLDGAGRQPAGRGLETTT
jgi:hypothetical protein